MKSKALATTPAKIGPALAVIGAVSVFTVTLGINYPYLTVLLKARGFSTSFVGLNAAMIPIGLVVGSLLTPRIALVTGPYVLSLCSITASFATLAALYAWYAVADDAMLPFLLMPLCISLGIFINGLFVVGEAWINRLAPDAARGRILGVYTTALIAGYGVGPILLSLAAGDALVIQATSLGLLVAAALPLLAFRSTISGLTFAPEPGSDGGARDMLRFALMAPYLVLCFASIAFFDNVAMSMKPIFGSARGLEVAEASRVLGAIIIGGACFQPLIGALADRFPNRRVVLVFSIATVLLSVPMARIESATLLTVLAFVWGGVAFATYTMALKELGDRYTGAPLLTGSAVLALTWGLTTIVGLPLTGLLLDGTSPLYLPMILVVLYVPLILASLRR
ncbi:MFS transporter [Salinarimonas sp.]|uniref:MFS transporter n=1 Tax=Salinarimonas sp. TaxID=2766526 RepID=UPI0032D935E1